MIIVKGEIKTKQISYCEYNELTHKYDIRFNHGQIYSYTCDNVEYIERPKILDPDMYYIFYGNEQIKGISSILLFENKKSKYWHLCFYSGWERDYFDYELKVIKSCLEDPVSADTFEYLKRISSLNGLRNEAGEKLLEKQYNKMGFVREDSVLAMYLKPQDYDLKSNDSKQVTPIFPFGCNKSQYEAVKNALENPLSVIQGPPGTGKTQTILNIIANILAEGKTVQVVSNNNSATENIWEKLSTEKHNMGFLVASLGKVENKRLFLDSQSELLPNLSAWKLKETDEITLEEIKSESESLRKVFEKQERLAILKQELSSLEIELKYFNKYLHETNVDINKIKLRRKISSSKIMELWQECQSISEQEKSIGLFFKLKSILYYGISNWNFYKQDISMIITSMQSLFYMTRLNEITREFQEIEKELKEPGIISIDTMCDKSMMYFKNMLYSKYGGRRQRKIFSEENLKYNMQEFLDEYPIVLSTTFSSRSNLDNIKIYDYLIMDEASQVDIATGALALSCAKNVVIVGDTKQLPNVLTDDDEKCSQDIFEYYNIHKGYQYSNSFLKSILDIFSEVPQTLLKEHYRCHPKIIDFCNQKFYNGELIIMTDDNHEKDVLSIVKTVEGNHERNHYNQRQIDVIKREVLPILTDDNSEIGIIAPYNNQVRALRNEINNIDIATVHKLQGKEKDTIIISTVDNEITDFTDDPYLINVAISRAKKKLCVVVSGNEQSKDRNISDLIAYVQYNNFEVRESNIYSIFDYLYKQYTKSRYEYLKNHKKVSQYDSENLMYTIITDVLKSIDIATLDVICHQPLNMLIRDLKLLNEREIKYVMNPATHIDFLIYNKISKNPVLAIEVDGYIFHNATTSQSKRDEMKNHILKLYNIPLIRLATTGSQEKEVLYRKLKDLLVTGT
ncbi:AAA domain-containing protein [Alloiococcus sp. CFN-8]|uniref:AAA domain-containing protein n=1 Tax=Alloiococcus sp. CFN-8 TaxID=3416081 RepID=UPI003CF4DE49